MTAILVADSQSTEKRLNKAELIEGILSILGQSALANYDGSNSCARRQVYTDGTVGFIFTSVDGFWCCERIFGGGGLRTFSFIDSNTECSFDEMTVEYRGIPVWNMYCRSTLSKPTLMGHKRIDVLMSSSRAAASSKLSSWFRNPECYPIDQGDKKLHLTTGQHGGVEHFSGNERAYMDNETVYYGSFIGGLCI